MLAFHVDLADIFTDHAKANQLYTGHKADDTGHGSPAGNSVADQSLNDCPDNAEKAYKCNKNTKAGDESDGLDRKTGDAVKGQLQHFGKRIVALTCNAFVAFISDSGGFKAYQRDHAAKK